MLKRPLHARFGPKVLAGIKRTTIRDTAWLLHKPIMLYHWTGKPYRSPQQDVAAVEVVFTCSISLCHARRCGTSALQVAFNGNDLMDFHAKLDDTKNNWLWQLEGFDSRDAMDAWFLPLIKPGQTVHKHLMLFRLLNPEPSNLKPVSP